MTTLLQQANHAQQSQDHVEAIRLYVRALQQRAPLAQVLVGNLQRAQKAYRAQRAKQGAQKFPHVLVSSWDLSLNAAGRAATLAQIWAHIGQAEVIGCLYPPQKSQLWEPLRDFPLPIHSLHITPGQSFIQQALDFVLLHPCDLLHLSKPRWPNILLGVLYKLVWACQVWMDVDDEELAFVKADSPLSLIEYFQTAAYLPDTPQSLWSVTCTRLGVGLVNAFDEVTTVNSALQQRYGGSIVHHARDGAHFAPNAQRRNQARAKLGIEPEDTVILFAGTPRAHKGLLETARAIVQQRRSDLVFLIAGDFPDNLRGLQQQIVSMPRLRAIMLPNQVFQTMPDTLAAGDICVLLQDMDSVVAQYQTPAKLTDALAMGLIVLATSTPSLADFAEQGAFINVPVGKLTQVLEATLKFHPIQKSDQPLRHPLFERLLSISANKKILQGLWNRTLENRSQELNSRLIELAIELKGLEPLLPEGAWTSSIIKPAEKLRVEEFSSERHTKINQTLVNWKALEEKDNRIDKVSIVILIYNQLELTKKCLKSVLESKTIIDYEIICVNNGSDADMNNFLENICDRNVVYIKNPENYNFALGCNIGFSKASGNIIVFLNNDTEVTDGWLDELVFPLKDEKIAAVQPKLLFPDGSIQNIGIVFSKNQVFGYPIYANFDSKEACTNISRSYQAITGACMAVRAIDFAKAQGFDPLFINGMEDVDLCLRLTDGGKLSCYYQSSSVVFHHESKTEGRGRYIDLNRMNFSRRWYGKIVPDEEKYYLQDGFEITGWQTDSKKRMDLNLAIHRPILKNRFI